MTENKEIIVSSRNTASMEKTRFMEDRNITTYMKAEYRRASPGRVGVSIFLEGDIDGNRFRGGKAKNVKAESVAKIRESLDNLGKGFNEMSMENASDKTFDDLIDGIFTKVVRQDED